MTAPELPKPDDNLFLLYGKPPPRRRVSPSKVAAWVTSVSITPAIVAGALYLHPVLSKPTAAPILETGLPAPISAALALPSPDRIELPPVVVPVPPINSTLTPEQRNWIERRLREINMPPALRHREPEVFPGGPGRGCPSIDRAIGGC